MKTLIINQIDGLDTALSIDSFRELLAKGTNGNIDCLNWPDHFPYKPECGFAIGWCRQGIGILFNVKGSDLRAIALEDNGNVWEDSCCEFFLSHPTDGTYFNFELNCIGTLLAAKRKSRTECTHFPQEKLAQIKRFSTLAHERIDIADEEKCWSNGMFIPFSLIGIDGDNPPESIRLNIYKCGDKTAHPHFLSWAPVRTEKPDFHRPEFFGEALLYK